MTWSRLDPGAGDPSAIRAMAAVRSDEVEELTRRVAADIESAQDVGQAWMGSAASEFNSRLGAVRGTIRELARGYDQHADALLGYASEVEQIARAASNIRARESANAEELRVLLIRRAAAEDDPTQALLTQQLEAKIRAARAEDRGIEQEWDALTVRRTEADRAFVSEVGGGPGGSNSDFGTAYTADGLYTDGEFMTVLSGMTAAQVAARLGSDPDFAARLAAMQDADAVAEWWQSLAPPVGEDEEPVASAEQLALLAAAPALFGNLNGIWYTHRDLANRDAFASEYDRLKAIDAEFDALRGTGVNDPGTEALQYLAEQGYNVSTFFAALHEAEAIDATLLGAGDYTYQFVLYQPGDPTFAAVSVGNMDTATQVTTAVPGMGSTVTKSLHEWTLSAQNIYNEQSAINELHGTEGGLAVVAWIGYDSPQMIGDVANNAPDEHLQVLSSESAVNGAPNLIDFLEGVTSTQDWDAGENLSVIAHSYGTTVASLALTETPVENFIMLGSAGLDNSIPDASYLQVDPDNVWASEASGDNIADLGQGDIQIGGSDAYVTVPLDIFAPIAAPIVGGVSPLLGLVLTPAIWSIDFQHTVDPTNEAYGGNVFSSEGATVNGEYLEGSDGHISSPQLEHQLNNTTTDQYGYLDAGTNPLHNAALLSLGITDGVTPVGGGASSGASSSSGGSSGNGASGDGGGGGGAHGR